MKKPFGPAGDVDARAAYLFFCPFTNRYGVTLDKSGAIRLSKDAMPAGSCRRSFRSAFMKRYPHPWTRTDLAWHKVCWLFVWREGPGAQPARYLAVASKSCGQYLYFKNGKCNDARIRSSTFWFTVPRCTGVKVLPLFGHELVC